MNTINSTSEKFFPYPVHTQKLENGLTVITVPTEHRGLVAYYTAVRAGSRNEVEPGKSGFAHFFEHMMFRGTEKYPQDKYNAVLKSLGADSNAFTSNDWTCYHIVAAVAELETLFAIESDRFQNLKYAEPEFQKEARAVLGEYNKNASSPFLIMDEKLRDAAFTKHTYKHSTLGFLDDIKDMPNQFEYSRVFFDRWYRPENCYLILVGDVDPRQVVGLAKKYYGPWQKPPVEKITIETEPPQTEEKQVSIDWPNQTLPYLYMGYHVPAFDPNNKEWVAMDAIAQLLFSESAPLYQDLVLDRQLVDLLRGFATDQRDPSLFRITARIKDEKNIAEVRSSIERAIVELAEQGPDAQRFQDVKEHMRNSFLRELDSPDAVAQTLGAYLQLTGEVKTPDVFFANLKALQIEDIAAAAKKYFVSTNRTIVTLKGTK